MAVIIAPPFGIEERASGVFYELSEQICKQAGVECLFSFFPYARIVNHIKSGKADFTLLFSNPTLAANAQQVSRILNLQNIIVGQQGGRLTSLEELQGLRLGMLRGAVYSEKLAQKTDITEYRADTYVQLVKMLKNGRLDAIVGVKTSIFHAAASLGVQPEEFFGKPLDLGYRPVWVHVSNKVSVTILEKVRKAAERVRTSDLPDRLAIKYYQL
ncbi:transporter substrate-binding domain-containing protein [Thalassomonas sp. RHCl1]|uniref:substrate-binding periplasmic protein n=1 Tax=Thalassomonas sp. RHCl1 TaxID=2995320 RepID=UPI00248B1F7E|nr:transporter substrate-binding domain-containing protein [Thalassomonas sp. RHCl1]